MKEDLNTYAEYESGETCNDFMYFCRPKNYGH